MRCTWHSRQYFWERARIFCTALTVVGDGSKGKGKITITTRQRAGSVEITIADTGTGISDCPQAICGRTTLQASKHHMGSQAGSDRSGGQERVGSSQGIIRRTGEMSQISGIDEG